MKVKRFTFPLPKFLVEIYEKFFKCDFSKPVARIEDGWDKMKDCIKVKLK